jgi:hypothetical protein
MLKITIPAREQFDERTNEFVYVKEQTLQLEHSLVSLSKWEAKWCKAFVSKREKTYEETIDYIRCMTITQNVKPEVYYNLTQKDLDAINAYIEAPMTATYLSEDKKGKQSKDVVTSELIYYWMISLGIPPEYDKWHLNRLLTLINLCNRKNQPSGGNKTNKRDLASQYAALNAARRKKFNSKG